LYGQVKGSAGAHEAQVRRIYHGAAGFTGYQRHCAQFFWAHAFDGIDVVTRANAGAD